MWWTALASFTFGFTSIWSLHFIAMLAQQLPVPHSYRPILTLLSAFIAILFVRSVRKKFLRLPNALHRPFWPWLRTLCLDISKDGESGEPVDTSQSQQSGSFKSCTAQQSHLLWVKSPANSYSPTSQAKI